MEPQFSFRGSCAQIGLMHGAPDEVEVRGKNVQEGEDDNVE